jgi:hypothetical protein
MVLHRPFRHFVRDSKQRTCLFYGNLLKLVVCVRDWIVMRILLYRYTLAAVNELCDTPMCPPVHSDSIPNILSQTLYDHSHQSTTPRLNLCRRRSLSGRATTIKQSKSG